MKKIHFKMFKAGKKWCVMGLTTLSLVLGTVAFSGSNVKADTINQDTTTQIIQVQSNIDNLQKNVNDATNIANNADQKVKVSQQAVDEAQNEVINAQDNVNKSNSIVVDAQSKLNEEKVAQNTANGKLDNDKKNISNKNEAVISANNELETAKQGYSKRQDEANNANAGVVQAQNDVNQQKNKQDEIQKKIDDVQGKIDNLNDQINSINRIEVSGNYLKNLQENSTITDEEAQVLNKNKYHNSSFDRLKVYSDLNDLSQGDWISLATFAASLINPIREANNLQPLKVTKGSVNFSSEIANNYIKHEYYDGYNTSGSVSKAASNNGLWNFHNYLKITGELNRDVSNSSSTRITLGNYTRSITFYKFNDVTFNDLKRDTYHMILNAFMNPQDAQNLLGNYEYLGVTGMDQTIALVMIGDNDIENYSNFNQTEYSIPTDDTSSLKKQISECESTRAGYLSTLTEINKAINVANEKLTDAKKNQLEAKNALNEADKNVKAKQVLVDNANEELDLAKQELTNDQKIADGYTVKEAELKLKDAQKNQSLLKEVLNTKRDQLSKKQSTLEEAQQAQKDALKNKQVAENKLSNARNTLQELKNKLLNGWKTENGKTYYYVNGEKQTGFLELNGKMYYLGTDGIRWDNKFYNNWGHTYYFGSDGARWDNKFYNNWGRTYYFGSDGARWDNKFYNNWGRTYYFGSDGARWDNTFMVKWGRAYYFGSDGALMTNQTRQINGVNYHFNQDGVIDNLRNQFITDYDGKVYYFDNNGQLFVNQFYNNWGRTYYFGNDGARWDNKFYSNWGHTYYFGSDGARYTNQWYRTEGAGDNYYFGNDGAALVGNHVLGDYDYYFNEKGLLVRTKEVKNY
ncbi:SEC10/PgrA surface exclusion domain-containing protein [Limosilactobacillus reuteri]|uniref:SEC10/PgrA surface exclusion domain-containing protein n=1 Tax=Limosilactobacillus reuteri TaxID=1598 RepID=UPI003D7817F6